MRVLGLLLAIFFSFSAFAQAPSNTAPVIPRKIPTADFAKPSFIERPLLSPDAKRVLARASVGKKTVLLVHGLEAGIEQKRIGIPEKSEMRWYRWAGNDRVLISYSTTVPWFDDEAELTRLVVYSLSTGKSAILGRPKDQGLEGDDLLYTDPSGEWILLSIQKTIYDYPSVFRINLADNKMTEVVKQRSDVWEWYADNDGVVRAGIGTTERKWSMVYRKTEAEKFRKLGSAKFDDEDAALDIMRFSRDSDDGFVLRNHETGRYALYKFNYATKQVGEKVFESATNDISDFDLAADGKSVRAVWYTDERDRVVWFDPALKEIQADIDKAVKSSEAWIISRAQDNKAMLISVSSASNPGSIYMFRPEVGVMQLVARVNEAIKPGEMGATSYIKYKARDGLDIPAYLTLPKGRAPKNLPLIILPHGGPYGVRDRPDYDPEVQFLANRGYAVLRPNYRGSEGYGKAFYEKGEGQWGRQMQDDLDDGMDHLAKEGMIDPKRVCVVGSSYGGYAAMWAATRNPERYRCGASYAGVMDLGKQLKYQLDFGISRRYRKDWRSTVQGNQKFDLKSVSPLYTVDRLTRPVMVVHGDEDQVVPYTQSKLYADALKKAGKDVEFYTYVKEGHSFTNSDNFKDWLDRLDVFLAKHNPAG